MNNRIMRKMNDAMNIIVDMNAIDAFYFENVGHPRIYLYVNGAKIVLEYKDNKTFKEDIRHIYYFMQID